MRYLKSTAPAKNRLSDFQAHNNIYRNGLLCYILLLFSLENLFGFCSSSYQTL